MMVDSNLTRSNILPSEKAFAYKMKLDAMKRQGKRTDLTSSPLETKLIGGRSDKELAESAGTSKATIHRYIRLTNLTPMLLHMVDEGKVAMRPAVELSYLPEHIQDTIVDCMSKEDCTPSHYQAIRMRNMFNEGTLTEEAINQIMSELKPNQTNRISLSEDKVKKLLPKNLPVSRREEFILNALQHYNKYLKKQKEQER